MSNNVIAFPRSLPERCSRIIAVRRQGCFHYVVLLDDQSLESGCVYERLDVARRMAAFWTKTVIETGPPEAFGRAHDAESRS
jgi:hypothetical protein